MTELEEGSTDTIMQVQRTVHTVKQFVTWFRHDSLVLRPTFQRNDIWSSKQKSFLLDSVLKGFPLPLIILRDSSNLATEQRLEVVDGQQRLTTFLCFVMPEKFPEAKRFTISRMHNRRYAAMEFQDLPSEAQLRILNYELSVHILPSQVPDSVVLQVFSRLNSTGLKLNDQELRNAEYYGAFKLYVEDLSSKSYDFWKKNGFFSPDRFARMADRRFVAELTHRMMCGTAAMTAATLNKIYRENDEAFEQADILSARFLNVIELIEASLGPELAKHKLNGLVWFYTIFGAVYDRCFEGANDATTSTKPPSGAFWEGVLNFGRALGDPTVLAPDRLKALMRKTTHLEARRARDQFFFEFLGPSI